MSALRKRIGEMREPPLGLDEVPHEALQIAFDEIAANFRAVYPRLHGQSGKGAGDFEAEAAQEARAEVGTA